MDENRLLKYIQGTLSDAEREQVERWYEESDDHKALLDNLQEACLLERAVVSRDSVDVDSAWKRCKATLDVRRRREMQERSRVAMRRFVRRMAAAAAVIVVMVSAGWYGYDMVECIEKPLIVRTDIGERVRVELPDGSSVKLNACSEIVYHRSIFKSERNLDLKGEAYFEVAKMKKTPFIVHCERLDIEVLGTRFNVQANDDDDWVTASLFEGAIRVSSPDISQNVVMKPNQQFTFNKRTHTSDLSTMDNGKWVTDWINGQFLFYKETFEQIAHALERHYNITIHFQDEAIRHKKFICNFSSSDNIRHILSIMQMTGKFDYQIDGRDVTIRSRE